MYCFFIHTAAPLQEMEGDSLGEGVGLVVVEKRETRNGPSVENVFTNG